MTPAQQHFRTALVLCPAVLVTCLVIDALFIPLRVLTPFHEHPPVHPLYAFWIPALSLRILGPVVIGVGYMLWVWYSSRSEAKTRFGGVVRVVIHAVWLVLFATFLAAVRLPVSDLGASLRIYAGEDFWDDVRLVKTPANFLEDFASLHHRDLLSLHGKTHPPGHTLFLWAVTELIGRSTHAAALAILLVGSTGIVPTYLLARRIADDRVANRALVLYPVIPAVAMYSISSSDFLFAAIAAWSLWLAVDAVLGTNAIRAVFAGAVGGLAAMFSTAEVFVGLIVGLFAVIHWIDRPGTAVRPQLLWMALGLGVWFVGMRLAFDFDYLECVRLTMAFHRKFIREIVGGMGIVNRLYTSVGNLVAFGWYLGVPVVAGATRSVVSNWRHRVWNGSLELQFTRVLWGMLAVMSFGGFFVLEVERIWLFMIGPVAVAACAAMPQFGSVESERRWLISLAGINCLQGMIYESFFFTIW